MIEFICKYIFSGWQCDNVMLTFILRIFSAGKEGVREE